jgi:galactose mutarotase-like enzyme
MPGRPPITLTDTDGTTAVIAPELGGWLLRYARPLAEHGLVDALHFSSAVVARYPRDMWAGMPVLFPIAGRNRAGNLDHHYEWNGRVFEMAQHGFARRCRWQVTQETATSVALELTDSDATRADYPFAFRHCLTYRLTEGRLAWEQRVENRSDVPMPFSTGFHPYLTVPLAAASRREACFVEIPEARRFTPTALAERFTSELFPAQNWSVEEDVAEPLFLGDLKQRELVLVDPVGRLEVVFNFEDAPAHRFVVLWSRTTHDPFYCVEPWTALPNPFGRPKDRELIVLEPHQAFRAAMWMELRPMA